MRTMEVIWLEQAEKRGEKIDPEQKARILKEAAELDLQLEERRKIKLARKALRKMDREYSTKLEDK
jgi:mRNA-degrading endonuclease RelE of RelBE toxin-antitoxin system